MERYLPFLATTASSAPFIGLFGTVWGIMTAFQGIGQQGSANLAVVAPGISEALIATAAGLGAAIPAVMGYNFFVNRVKHWATEMEGFTLDLLNALRAPGAEDGAGAQRWRIKVDTPDRQAAAATASAATLSEINIIPLVDVILVLLLIFMLTAPLMYRGIDVNLPKSSGKPTAVEERMVLTVTKEQTIYLNDKPVALARGSSRRCATCSRTAGQDALPQGRPGAAVRPRGRDHGPGAPRRDREARHGDGADARPMSSTMAARRYPIGPLPDPGLDDRVRRCARRRLPVAAIGFSAVAHVVFFGGSWSPWSMWGGWRPRRYRS